MDYYTFKNKYLEIKKQFGGEKYNYYFVHGTKNLKSIKSMLKDGKIKLGKDVKESQRVHSGKEPLPYIYANIYFEELRNLSHYLNSSIILHPKIINDYNIIFNKGWNVYPEDNFILNKNNLSVIKKFLKNPESLPSIVKEFPGIVHHECLFDREIDLKKYLIGIVYVGITKKKELNLRKILKKYNYPDIKILGNNMPQPLNYF